MFGKKNEFDFRSNLLDSFEQSSGIDFTSLNKLHHELEAMQPFSLNDKDGLQSYSEQFAVSMNYHSNAIEGSTLTLAETAQVMEGESLLIDKEARFIYAAKGIQDAGAFLGMLQERDDVELTQELIKDIHELVAQDIPVRNRGTYRTSNVYISGSSTVTSPVLSVRERMDDLLRAFKNSSLHPVEKIAAFHVFFENIHPFQDGNGRTGRLLMNFMLESADYQPILIKNSHKAAYCQALEDWQTRGERLPFLSIVQAAQEHELTECLQIVRAAREAERVLAREVPN